MGWKGRLSDWSVEGEETAERVGKDDKEGERGFLTPVASAVC